ncbi:DinB superfamily protein [Pedococcus dokdonensis]|uniref:DinB superfamily protein n=1 Tax=Pedococcus dokdonensis TaxID=443156 RepID=A0A1H0TR71_9MICO|nr:DinB family protein [Pedococcus dokdonensis]SDP56537.1 DinB superfamily protein [Pedococcus dokdonensis]
MTEQPDPISPDTKDWTWTLRRPCPDCGFEAAAVAATDIAGLTRSSTAPWSTVLQRPDATQRPAPDVWSALEYACHVRDVCRVFDGRLGLMLEQDAPRFANWDQDATAVAERYGEQDPAVVASELEDTAAGVSARFEGVRDDQWARTGLRSDGSEFTVLTLGQYFLHDLAHHLVDVRAAG